MFSPSSCFMAQQREISDEAGVPQLCGEVKHIRSTPQSLLGVNRLVAGLMLWGTLSCGVSAH